MINTISNHNSERIKEHYRGLSSNRIMLDGYVSQLISTGNNLSFYLNQHVEHEVANSSDKNKRRVFYQVEVCSEDYAKKLARVLSENQQVRVEGC